MGAPETNLGMESPSALEIPGAVAQNGGKAHGVSEPPASTEAAKAPIEQNGVTNGGNELPAMSVEAREDSVEQNGHVSEGPDESLAPVEVPHIATEQNGAVSELPPEAPGEPNTEETEVAVGLTTSLDISKADSKEIGQTAGGSVEALVNEEAPIAVVKEGGQKGSAESLADVEAPMTRVDNDGENFGDSPAEVPTSLVAPETAIEQSSGPEEFDNVEKINKEQNSSSVSNNGATNGNWEPAENPENPSVLGPGPSEAEKSGQQAPAKQNYCYYMIKIPRFSDSKGKTEIRMADLRLREMTQKRDFINAALQMRRASRTEALHKLRNAREKVRTCVDAMRQKKEEVYPLQGTLRRIRDTGRQARDKNRDLPASQKELDEKIAYCEYRIQHESIPLKEEKLLLREIKSLNASREAVCANEALQTEFSESLGEQDDIQKRLKPLTSELESLKSELTVASEACRIAEAEFEEIDTAFIQVQDQWISASQARQEAYIELSTLTKHDNAQSNEFFQNRRDIQHVRQLAFKTERKAVEEFCNAQVERVMALWNGNPDYRATYVKSNERSTLKRLQTFDGRALGPDEEPPLISGDGDGPLPETRADIRSLVSPAKSQKEEPAATNNLVPQTADSQRRGKNLKPPVVVEPSRHLPSSNAAAATEVVSNGQAGKGEEDSIGAAGMQASLHAKEKQAEEDLAAAAKLKQMRREEEMAKARSAEERKKKSAQRLQLKAEAKARKEAERQEKEKEKRSQKKAARSANVVEKDTPATELGREAAPEVEKGLDPVHEPAPRSRSISKHSKRSSSQISKTTKSPLDSSLIKKDGVRPLTWLLGVGLVAVVAILALVAVFVYNS